MSSLFINACSDSIKLYIKRFFLLFLTFLASIVIPASSAILVYLVILKWGPLLDSVMGEDYGDTTFSFILLLLIVSICLVFSLILAGAGSIYLKVIRSQKVNFSSDFFSGFSKWKVLIPLTFVKGICIFICLVLFIFSIASSLNWGHIFMSFLFFMTPAVYLARRWFFVFPLVFDKGYSLKKAFSKSSKMTQGRFWEVFIFLLFISTLGYVFLVLPYAFFLKLPYVFLTLPYAFLVKLSYFDRCFEKSENTE